MATSLGFEVGRGDAIRQRVLHGLSHVCLADRAIYVSRWCVSEIAARAFPQVAEEFESP
jgi:hypothetical protein